jgi:glutamine phosphoribosylpyrophosphate amidotransferase
MSICSSRGLETRRLRTETEMPDAFQAVYFGNVSSLYRGQEVFHLRMGLGHKLAKMYGDTDADVVIANPDSGRGVSHGIAAGLGKPLLPGLVKQAQAIRTFQEAGRSKRMREVAVKFAALDSVLVGRRIIMGDDSIVKGSVSEGGVVWTVYNAGAIAIEFWVSYGPMFFPSFKEWRRGRECLGELAVQRAFRGDNPNDKSPGEINAKVAALLGVDRVCYNSPENVRAVVGAASYQALDASYPISEQYWPAWLKEEVEYYRHYR